MGSSEKRQDFSISLYWKKNEDGSGEWKVYICGGMQENAIVSDVNSMTALVWDLKTAEDEARLQKEKGSEPLEEYNQFQPIAEMN